MVDKRRRHRKNTPHHVKVLDNESGQVLGRIVDITSSGMMIVSDRAIKPGKAMVIRLNLPIMVQNRTDMVIEAQSVWCNQDQNPRFFRAGFKFSNISGEDGYLLEEVMLRFNLVG